MKKTYKKPAQLVCKLQVTKNMMTPYSLQGGNPADPDAEVLTKEYIWDDDEDVVDGYIPKNPNLFE